jgi:mRNA interferase MazF
MIKNYFLLLLDWLRTMVMIQDKKSVPSFKEGEIWWCMIGMNIGKEIFGKGGNFARPVIVFKKIGTNTFLGIPMTTQLKNGSWYAPIFYGGIEQRAILSQIRVLDEKRLIKPMGTLSHKNVENLKKQFAAFYVS